MKTTLLVLALAALSLTGCSNLSSTVSPTTIQGAAQLGSSVAIMANPQYRAGMVAGSAVLSQFCTTNAPFTFADVQAALAQIKINGSAAKYVPLYLSDAMSAINIFGGNIPSLNSTNLTSTNQFLGQLQTGICAANAGIQQTLNASAP